jgi:hypothetical protein
MGEYDVTLRHVIRTGGSGFLHAVGAGGRLRPILTDFPNTRNRQVDFLAVLENTDGGRKLLHVEFQSAPDPGMAARMLGYCSDILTWLGERRRKSTDDLPQELLQKVVYVGSKTWTPASGIDQANLRFRFDFVNALSLNARALLQTGDLGDAVIAVLCGDGTNEDVVKAILTKVAQAPEKERGDALAQLLALAKLRGIRPLIEREYKTMGIVVNVEDIELLREPIDRARAEGFAKGQTRGEAIAIERILRSRFPGNVPDGLADHLGDLLPEALEDILQKCWKASSVEEALGTHMPAKLPGLGD